MSHPRSATNPWASIGLRYYRVHAILNSVRSIPSESVSWLRLERCVSFHNLSSNQRALCLAIPARERHLDRLVPLLNRDMLTASVTHPN